jgi:Protein of unknown function (DUF3485)
MFLRALTIAALGAATLLACQFSPPIRSGDEAGVILKLPGHVGPLYGQEDKPSEEELRRLPSDTEFAKRTYVTATDKLDERDIVRMTIVLAGSERRSIHRPEVCLPGQGWTIISGVTRPIEIAHGKVLQVRDLTIEGHAESNAAHRPIRAHYVYWFVGTDTTTPSHIERTMLSTWDSIVRGVNHRWAYVSLMTNVTEGFAPNDIGERSRSNEQSQHLIDYIVQSTVPQFQKSFMAVKE